MAVEISPIAHVFTPYKQKFAIPRQPGLVKEAKGIIRFEDEFNDPNCIRDLEQFSHLWLIFQFHKHQGWSPLVRPPRLGGNTKTGVFATRSSFRPNGLGMSVVELCDIRPSDKGLCIEVAGIDLLDATPLFDIKPYIPYADSIKDARGGFAHQAPSLLPVTFSKQAITQLEELNATHPCLKSLIISVLEQDPRPAYHQNSSSRVYGMNLDEFNINFEIRSEACIVSDIRLSETDSQQI